MKLEYIITAYCIVFLIMGFGFGMYSQGNEDGIILFVIGFAIQIFLAVFPTTSTTSIRKYRIVESD